MRHSISWPRFERPSSNVYTMASSMGITDQCKWGLKQDVIVSLSA